MTLEQKKYLNDFLDWIVLRQHLPQRRVTVRAWVEINWPEACEADIDFLWENFGRYIEIKGQ